jgi:hypothetical protein
MKPLTAGLLRTIFASGAALAVLATGCSSSGNSRGQTPLAPNGGASGTGSAGAVATGGALGVAGAAGSVGSGGVVAQGGAVGKGGTTGAGGFVAPGGSIGAGGAIGTGGMVGAGGGAIGGMVGAGGSVGAGGAQPTGPGCLKGTGDYSKAGPYMVTTKSVDLASKLSGAASPTTYTIFYPTMMDTSCPAPVIAWGNGTTVTGSSVYAFFNNNAASWGMVVIASDNPSVAASPFLNVGIDYAGTSGHSQGAIAATTASNHAAVTAEVQVEGGGFPKKGIAFLALSGTADNIVGTMAPTSSYGAATGPSMLAIYTGADHLTTPTVGGFIQGNAGSIQFMRFYTAWFRCFLADDANACAMFKGGQNCGVCKDPNWDMLQTKNM